MVKKIVSLGEHYKVCPYCGASTMNYENGQYYCSFCGYWVNED